MAEVKRKERCAQLRQQTPVALEELLLERLTALRQMRFEHLQRKKVIKTHHLGLLRRDIARIKTLLTVQRVQETQTT